MTPARPNVRYFVASFLAASTAPGGYPAHHGPRRFVVAASAFVNRSGELGVALGDLATQHGMPKANHQVSKAPDGGYPGRGGSPPSARSTKPAMPLRSRSLDRRIWSPALKHETVYMLGDNFGHYITRLPMPDSQRFGLCRSYLGTRIG